MAAEPTDMTSTSLISVGRFTAVILGATGATGRHLVEQLISHPQCSQVRVLGRRSVIPLLDQDLVVTPKFEEILYESLGAAPTAAFQLPSDGCLKSFDMVFCTLGTTLKNAGSKEAFMSIDHDLLLQVARKAREAEVPIFSYISASGANADSCIFYNRVKGLNERDLEALQFPSLLIFRPSLLITSREEDRSGEKIAQTILPALDWMVPSKYKTIRVEDVARAMIWESFRSIQDGPVCVQHFENDAIHQTAHRTYNA